MVSKYAETVLRGIRKFQPDIEFIEIGIDKNHVHLHVVIPPQYSVGEMVNAMKVNSEKKLKEKFRFLEEVYWGTDSLWSTEFFVSTIWCKRRNYTKLC